jgi:hypothetical protein
LHSFQKRSGSKRPCGIGAWLHLPLKLIPSKFRATITDLYYNSTPTTYAKSMPSLMETRNSQKPPIPRRRENQNILPVPK